MLNLPPPRSFRNSPFQELRASSSRSFRTPTSTQELEILPLSGAQNLPHPGTFEPPPPKKFRTSTLSTFRTSPSFGLSEPPLPRSTQVNSPRHTPPFLTHAKARGGSAQGHKGRVSFPGTQLQFLLPISPAVHKHLCCGSSVRVVAGRLVLRFSLGSSSPLSALSSLSRPVSPPAIPCYLSLFFFFFSSSLFSRPPLVSLSLFSVLSLPLSAGLSVPHPVRSERLQVSYSSLYPSRGPLASLLPCSRRLVMCGTSSVSHSLLSRLVSSYASSPLCGLASLVLLFHILTRDRRSEFLVLGVFESFLRLSPSFQGDFLLGYLLFALRCGVCVIAAVSSTSPRRVLSLAIKPALPLRTSHLLSLTQPPPCDLTDATFSSYRAL
ncbi:hypothetical protein C7M84_022454 [Penaeus vannamei]|uniref:Uncharacterized protein n=1 Tax=Penaeus vannamei TaxID=6689 RepID=A0A3R7MRX3_PENVA|nr:hypothetical protein C7M84_022454 [Penaeus vannamei]